MIERICFVTPEYPGCGPSYGVGRVAAVLSQAMRDLGIRTRVLACTDTGTFTIDGDRIHACGGPGGPFALRPLRVQAWLDRQIQDFAPDIIEASNWGGLTTLIARQERCVLRLATSTATISEGRWHRRLLKPVHLAWERQAVRRCRLLIADSTVMGQTGQALYGRLADVVIPHAMPVPDSIPISSGSDVLFVGRLEARKGIDLLLAAWEKIATHHPAIRLHVVGADPESFGAAALQRHHPANVVMHGGIDDAALAQLRRACAIHVVPSRFESFGLVVLEAWAHGLAVVATNNGALPEVVGPAGRMTAPTPEAIATALHDLLSNTAERQRLAVLGAVRLRQDFSPEAIARRSLDAYAR